MREDVQVDAAAVEVVVAEGSARTAGTNTAREAQKGAVFIMVASVVASVGEENKHE